MLHLSSRNCAKRNIRDPGTADARAQLVTLGTGSSLCSGRHDNMSCIALVMPGLVPGIHPSTHARANGEMDPRDKPEDDILEQPSPQTSSPRRAGGAHREGGDSGHFANEGAVEVSPRGASPPTRTPAARCTRFPPSCRRRVYDTTGMTPVESAPPTHVMVGLACTRTCSECPGHPSDHDVSPHGTHGTSRRCAGTTARNCRHAPR